MTSVAGVVADALARAGVDRVFAAGGQGLVADAKASGLAVVELADARTACVMAAVTGTCLGVPGAVVVEDVTAAADALAAALAEQSALVCIGQRGAIEAAAVKAVLDASGSSASHWIAHALQLAMAPPRGPVCLGAREGWSVPVIPVATMVRRAAAASPDDGALDRVAAVIRNAARPIVVAGIDARDDAACAWLRAFAEALPAPVLVTWKAKGALADPHPLTFGVLGTSAPAAAVLERADLVVALGCDAVDWSALPTRAPIVDAGPIAGADRPRSPEAFVTGDVGAILADLGPRLAGGGADWDVAELDRLKRQLDARATAPDVRRTVALAREAMPAGTIAAFEASVLSAAIAWDCVSPADLHVPARSRFVPFAVPAAIAAALARPSVVSLAFTDAVGLDASRMMLPVATRLGVAIGIVVTGDVAASRAEDRTVAVVRATTEAVFSVALSRLLAERRPMIIDITSR